MPVDGRPITGIAFTETKESTSGTQDMIDPYSDREP